MSLSKVANEAAEEVAAKVAEAVGDEVKPHAYKDLLILGLKLTGLGAALYLLIRWYNSDGRLENNDDDPKVDEAKIHRTYKEQFAYLMLLSRLNGFERQLLPNVVDTDQLNFGWEDIAGLDSTIDEIKRTVINPILANRYRKKSNQSALTQAPKGVLLYGQPGCGKTMIAKALAKESYCRFINVDLSTITDKWYGQTEKLTYALFTLARKLEPCIIFIDEIDSLLRTRGSQDHEVTAKVKAQFMSNWDGLTTDAKQTVILVGATNRPKDLDAAILRRMVCKFFIPAPDTAQRLNILTHILKNETLAPDFDIYQLAVITDGFTGSDLKEIARSAAVAALDDELANMELNKEMNLSNKKSKSWFDLLSAFNPFRSSGPQGAGDSLSGGEPTRVIIHMNNMISAIEKMKTAKAGCGTQYNVEKIE